MGKLAGPQDSSNWGTSSNPGCPETNSSSPGQTSSSCPEGTSAYANSCPEVPPSGGAHPSADVRDSPADLSRAHDTMQPAPRAPDDPRADTRGGLPQSSPAPLLIDELPPELWPQELPQEGIPVRGGIPDVPQAQGCDAACGVGGEPQLDEGELGPSGAPQGVGAHGGAQGVPQAWVLEHPLVEEEFAEELGGKAAVGAPAKGCAHGAPSQAGAHAVPPAGSPALERHLQASLVIQELAQEFWAEAEAEAGARASVSMGSFTLAETSLRVPRACSPLIEEPPTPEVQVACSDSDSDSGCESGGLSDSYGAPKAALEEAWDQKQGPSDCDVPMTSLGELKIDEGPDECGVPEAAMEEAWRLEQGPSDRGVPGASVDELSTHEGPGLCGVSEEATGTCPLEGPTEGMEVERGAGLCRTPEAAGGEAATGRGPLEGPAERMETEGGSGLCGTPEAAMLEATGWGPLEELAEGMEVEGGTGLCGTPEAAVGKAATMEMQEGGSETAEDLSSGGARGEPRPSVPQAPEGVQKGKSAGGPDCGTPEDEAPGAGACGVTAGGSSFEERGLGLSGVPEAATWELEAQEEGGSGVLEVDVAREGQWGAVVAVPESAQRFKEPPLKEAGRLRSAHYV